MTLPNEVLSKLKEAREHYIRYEELMDEVYEYIRNVYGVRTFYKETEDLTPTEKVDGVRALLTVIAVVKDKCELGALHVLEDGRVFLKTVGGVIEELTPKGD